MAQSRKRSVLEKKAKKKRWIPILAPEVFNRAVVGEMPLTSAEAARGRVLTANLMNITHDIKQQNINISLHIHEVKENQAFTKINSFKVMPAAIKRMTHRRIDVVEDSSIFITSDNVRVRVKPMLFTRGNTTNSVKRALRKGMRNIILKNVKKSKVEDLFRDALSNKIQYAVVKELSKFHPLKYCVIRELSIEKERTRRKAKAVESEVEVPKTRKGKVKDDAMVDLKKKKKQSAEEPEEAELEDELIAEAQGEEGFGKTAEPEEAEQDDDEFVEIPEGEPFPGE